MGIEKINSEILKKENFTEAERTALLASIQPPDCYILKSSSCDLKTKKEFDDLYAEAKNYQDDYYKTHPIDVEKTARFEEIIEDVFAGNKDTANYKEFEDCIKAFINTSVSTHLVSEDHNPNEPKFVSFVLGLPGAGKSSTIKEIRRKRPCFKAEQDDFKTVLAEHFGVDVNHPKMHKLSGIAMKEYMIPTLLEKGISFTQEKIGDEPGKMVALIQRYREAGYIVDVSMVHCPQDLAMKRNATRCIDKAVKGESPRCVERASYEEIADRPLLTYIYLMKEFPDLLRECGCYTTDVDFSNSPQELTSLALHRNNYLQEVQNLSTQVEQMRSLVEMKFEKFVIDNNYSDKISNLTKEDYDKIIDVILTKALNPATLYREQYQNYDMSKFEQLLDPIIMKACYKALEVVGNRNAMSKPQEEQLSSDKVSGDNGMEI